MPTNAPALAFTALALLGVFSLLWSSEPVFALRKSAYFLSMLPVLWMASAFTEKQKKTAFNGVLLAAILSAGVALVTFVLQFVLGAETIARFVTWIAPALFGTAAADAIIQFPSWYVATSSGPLFRAFFPFPNPHTAVLFWGFGLAVALGQKRPAIVTGVLIAAMLASFSRGGAIILVVLAATVAIFWMLGWKRHEGKERKPITPKRFVAAGLLLFVLFVSAPVLVERSISLADVQEGSVAGRLTLWGETLSVVQAAPLLGVGLGGLANALDPLASYRTPTNAHNTYLEIFSELGAVGITLFLIGILSTGYAVLSRGLIKSELATVIFLAMIVYMTHAVFESNLYYPANLFVLFVFVGAAGTMHKERVWK